MGKNINIRSGRAFSTTYTVYDPDNYSDGTFRFRVWPNDETVPQDADDSIFSVSKTDIEIDDNGNALIDLNGEETAVLAPGTVYRWSIEYVSSDGIAFPVDRGRVYVGEMYGY